MLLGAAVPITISGEHATMVDCPLHAPALIDGSFVNCALASAPWTLYEVPPPCERRPYIHRLLRRPTFSCVHHTHTHNLRASTSARLPC